MKRRLTVLLFCTLFFTGCDLREREIALEKKSSEIAQKEQELVLREQQLALKEEELNRRLQQADSSTMDSSLILFNEGDSTQPFNPAFAGNWSARMVCIQTSCAGSAIGDTKNEQWTISHQENAVIVQAYANNQLVRVYTGAMANNRLVMRAQQDSVAPPTVITAALQLKNPKQIEGTREIRRVNECQIVYKLELEKL